MPATPRGRTPYATGAAAVNGRTVAITRGMEIRDNDVGLATQARQGQVAPPVARPAPRPASQATAGPGRTLPAGLPQPGLRDASIRDVAFATLPGQTPGPATGANDNGVPIFPGAPRRR